MDEVKNKIGDIHHEFQPIFNLTNGEILGYEALIRNENFPPLEMFKLATAEGLLFNLDLLSFSLSLNTFYNSKQSTINKLFINLFPTTLTSPFFESLLNKIVDLSIPKGSVIIEINESQSIKDIESFMNSITLLRRLGFLIAIDDVGNGMSSLPRIIEYEPEFIKLDKYFSKGLSNKKNKQNMVAMFVNYCKQSNAKIILEGIEKEVDLSMAKKLGVKFGQGYLLGRPSTTLLTKTIL